ncbi:tetratricopeptide repeat protein [Pseudidiomarina mangrovi]|uniref:tetratricopeptide repeat protein n=1 Tax=Pseudidiomarina mangrovi TaxID=2487133 RepID=UPI000FCAA091|nr:hypothetical protein [Pseudidiomarina mangrovi]
MHSFFRIIALALLLTASPLSAMEPELPALEELVAGDLDDAEDFIDTYVKRRPQHAEGHFYRGNIMAMQAGNSTIWALSYAGKALESFEKAVELNPQNHQYRMALASFHFAAPGIAGGDIDEAWRQVAALKEFDPFHAMQLELTFWAADEDKTRYNELVENALNLYPTDPRLVFRIAMNEQSAKNYPQAQQHFSVCANADNISAALANPQITVHPDTAQLMELARLNCLYQIGRTAVISEADVNAGIEALDAYLQVSNLHRTLPPHDWARLRLAALLIMAEQPDQARQLLAQVKPSDDAMKEEHKALSQKL